MRRLRNNYRWAKWLQKIKIFVGFTCHEKKLKSDALCISKKTAAFKWSNVNVWLFLSHKWEIYCVAVVTEWIENLHLQVLKLKNLWIKKVRYLNLKLCFLRFTLCFIACSLPEGISLKPIKGPLLWNSLRDLVPKTELYTAVIFLDWYGTAWQLTWWFGSV